MEFYLFSLAANSGPKLGIKVHQVQNILRKEVRSLKNWGHTCPSGFVKNQMKLLSLFPALRSHKKEEKSRNEKCVWVGNLMDGVYILLLGET